MTDEEAFIASIKASPDEDAPRLVYADWLEENGDEDKALWIRLSCRLADRDLPLSLNEREEYEDKLADIRERRLEEWEAPYRPDIYGRWFLNWNRGFVSSLEVNRRFWREWYRKAKGIELLSFLRSLAQQQPIQKICFDFNRHGYEGFLRPTHTERVSLASTALALLMSVDCPRKMLDFSLKYVSDWRAAAEVASGAAAPAVIAADGAGTIFVPSCRIGTQVLLRELLGDRVSFDTDDFYIPVAGASG